MKLYVIIGFGIIICLLMYQKEGFALPPSFDPQIINSPNMGVRDLYTNLCPRGYNLKQLKLGNTVKKVNQLPGYTNNEFIDLTRKFPYPEVPYPTTADIFTPLNY